MSFRMATHLGVTADRSFPTSAGVLCEAFQEFLLVYAGVVFSENAIFTDILGVKVSFL